MRFTTAAVLVASAAASTVSAAGTVGWALGNKLEDGESCKTTSDYEADFDAIKEHTGSSVVRVYSTMNCNTAERILPVAKAKGFKVVLGIWVHSDAEDDASFVGDFDEAKRVIGDGSYNDQVYALTVGSESLYRGDVSGDFLAARIATVKDAFPQFKVGTADSWNMFQDGTADPVLRGAADILLVNAFSYWQGQEISNATGSFFDSIFQAYAHIEAIRGADDTTEHWVGETGWPSDGNNYQNAEPTLPNAEKFYREAVCGIANWGFNVFVFSAFDEPGKKGAVGEDGTVAAETHWGSMCADRSLKWESGLKC